MYEPKRMWTICKLIAGYPFIVAPYQASQPAREHQLCQSLISKSPLSKPNCICSYMYVLYILSIAFDAAWLFVCVHTYFLPMFCILHWFNNIIFPNLLKCWNSCFNHQNATHFNWMTFNVSVVHIFFTINQCHEKMKKKFGKFKLF